MSKKNPAISLVVTSWERPKDLLRCFKSILEVDFNNFELIVFDNHSGKEVIEIIHRFTQEIACTKGIVTKLLLSSKEKKLTTALNECLAKSEGDLFLFINNDNTLKKDTLKKLYTFYEKYECRKLGQIGLLTRFSNGKIQDCGRKVVLIKNRGIEGVCAYCSRVECVCTAPRTEVNSIFTDSVDFFYFYAIETQRLRQLGGYDEHFIRYHEDPDSGLSCRFAGFQNILSPAEIIHHVSKEFRFHDVKLDTNDSLYFYRKWKDKNLPEKSIFFPNAILNAINWLKNRINQQFAP